MTLYLWEMNPIAIDDFMTIVPYISPDVEKYDVMALSKVILLFLHGVLK